MQAFEQVVEQANGVNLQRRADLREFNNVEATLGVKAVAWARLHLRERAGMLAQSSGLGRDAAEDPTWLVAYSI